MRTKPQKTKPQKKTRTTLVLGAALAAALTLNACSAGPDDGTGAPSSQEAQTAHNSADVMFAQMMIPHHEQALTMSDLLLAQEGVDPEAEALAQQIKDAQGPEIEAMTGWLEDWDVEPGAVDHSGMDHGGMDGMLSPAQLEDLEAADAETATRLYLEGMIEHHEGAVAMAEEQLADGQFPPALRMAEEVIETQNAEIEQMRALLGHEPAAAGRAGGQSTGAPVSGDQAMLADHGLDGLDARAIIEGLDTQPVAERPQDLIASVGQEYLVLKDAAGREAVLPLPEDEVYVSAAPYVQRTHPCHLHSLTTCRGEMADQDVRVTVVDSTGEVVLDVDRRTYDNGFVGLWLPRGITGELTVTHAEGTATTAVSTEGPGDPTCLTQLPLRRA